MFQVIVFSKPLEDITKELHMTANTAAFDGGYSGAMVNQVLVSIEDVLLQRGESPTHKIMIRHFPDFAPNHTHFAFIGDEFGSEELMLGFNTYSRYPAATIDRRRPEQLIGAVLGHYYGVLESAPAQGARATTCDGFVTLVLEGVGILPEMLVIKAAIDKEA